MCYIGSMKMFEELKGSSFFVEGDYMRIRSLFCSYEYFTTHNCNGCRRSKECDDFYEKMDSMDSTNNIHKSSMGSNDEKNNNKRKIYEQRNEKKKKVG